MEASYSSYDFAASRDRIDAVLAASDATELNESEGIPPRSRLTYANGFYVYCAALFVDMRDSSGMTRKHRPATLARLYRAYVSEISAVLRNTTVVREINIHGDAVWAVYDTTLRTQIDLVFSIAAQAHSLAEILSFKHEKRGLSPFKVGVGMSYGRALMVKAGQKGSGLHDVVWMGDVVNEASHLAQRGNKTWQDDPLQVSQVFYDNLNETNQALLRLHPSRGRYHGNVVNIPMNNWLEAQQSTG